MLDKQTITPGVYRILVKATGRETIAKVTGEAPFLFLNAIDCYPLPSGVEFIARIPTYGVHGGSIAKDAAPDEIARDLRQQTPA